MSRVSSNTVNTASVFSQLGQTTTIPGSYVSELIIKDDVKQSDGIIPTKYFASSSYELQSQLTGTTWQSLRATWRGPMGTPLHVETGIGLPLRLRAQAANKAISAVKAQQVNLAMAFAQRKESLTLARNLVVKGSLVLAALARKDFREVAKLLGEDPLDRSVLKKREELIRRLKKGAKNVSSKHLAAVFGIVPLVSDIQGALAEVMSDPRPLEFVAKGYVKESRIADEIIGVPWRVFNAPGGYPPSEGTIRRSHTEAYISCRCFLRYRIDIKALSDASRLGLINPAYTLWDYIPWSFVFDWFANIGSWLNSLDSDVGMSFITGCYSERKFVTTSVNYDPLTRYTTPSPGQPAVLVVQTSHSTGAKTDTRFERWPISEPPKTVLQFKNPLSLFTIAASAALASRLLNTKRAFAPPKFRYRGIRTRKLRPITYAP